MSVLKLRFAVMLLLMGLFILPNNIFAQDKKEGKKKVVIVKKTVDKNGNEKIEKTIKEYSGDEEVDIEKMIKKNTKEGEEVEVEVTVTVDDNGKVKRERKLGKDSKEKVIVVEVDGDDVKINDEGEVMIIELKESEGTKKIKTDDGKEIIIIKNDGGNSEDVRIMLNEIDGEGLHEDHDEEIHIFKMDEDFKERAFFGVMINPEEGMELLDVVEDSPAEKAGLQKGDVLKSINGNVVNSYDELTEQLAKFKPQDEIDVIYERSGKTITTKAKLSQGTGMNKMIWKTEDGEIHEINGNHEIHIIKEGEKGEHKKIKKTKKIKKKKAN